MMRLRQSEGSWLIKVVQKSLRQEWADLMLELGDADKDVVTLVGDISHGILQPYANAYPGRYFNVGICEPSIVGLAAGMAHIGFVPFVHTIAPFLIERAFEQVKLDFGYQKLGVNLVSVGSSFDYSQLGCSHHTYADVSMVANIENSNVFLPSSAGELRSLLKHVYRRNGVNYFRLTENAHEVDLSANEIMPGKGLVVKEGHDVTVVALGPTLSTAMKVASELSGQISVEVVYIHSFKPFDNELVRSSVAKTDGFVTIEELGPQGGLFHSVLNATKGLDYSTARQLSVTNFVSGYGSHDDLTNSAGISSSDLLRVIVNSRTGQR